MWGYVKIMKIMSTKKYKELLEENAALLRQIERSIKKITKLEQELAYYKQFNATFHDIIFPNTDERGLGEQEIPVNFPDLW